MRRCSTTATPRSRQSRSPPTDLPARDGYSRSAAVKQAGATFTLPTPDEVPARLGAVPHVLYLIFNEGYTTSSGEQLTRTDLTAEAIRLTRAPHDLLPEDGEVTGLRRGEALALCWPDINPRHPNAAHPSHPRHAV